jgi:DNA-binding FadR family transcriptional regulator
MALHGKEGRSRSLTVQLDETLTERIRQGVYLPGAKLPTEADIAAEFGVSRTVVREAISRLQAGGAIERRHGVGTFVVDIAPLQFEIDETTKVTLRDILAMLELRIGLEVEAAGLAAARRSDAQVAEMEEILDRFDRNWQASTDTVEPDFDFHVKIAQATGNRYFVDVMSRLGTATIPRLRLPQSASDPNYSHYMETIRRQHQGVFGAIRRREPDTARLMMRLHLTTSRERFRRVHDEAGAHPTVLPGGDIGLARGEEGS